LFQFQSEIFFWTLASFGIVVLVLYFYVFPPILKVLEEREETQKKNLEQIETNMEEAKNLRESYENKLIAFQKDVSDRLIALEKEEGLRRKEATDIMAQEKKITLAQLENEMSMTKQEALRDFSGKMEEVIFAVVAKIIQKKLTVGDHEDIIDDCVKEMERKLAEEV